MLLGASSTQFLMAELNFFPRCFFAGAACRANDTAKNEKQQRELDG
jgi:hypothetical protein